MTRDILRSFSTETPVVKVGLLLTVVALAAHFAPWVRPESALVAALAGRDFTALDSRDGSGFISLGGLAGVILLVVVMLARDLSGAARRNLQLACVVCLTVAFLAQATFWPVFDWQGTAPVQASPFEGKQAIIPLWGYLVANGCTMAAMVCGVLALRRRCPEASVHTPVDPRPRPA